MLHFGKFNKFSWQRQTLPGHCYHVNCYFLGNFPGDFSGNVKHCQDSYLAIWQLWE